MLEIKLIAIYVFIGFLLLVSSYPSERSPVNTKYLLPTPLKEDDLIDIKLVDSKTNFFTISFMKTYADDDENIAYTFTVKLDDKYTKSQGNNVIKGYVYESKYASFWEDNAIAVYLSVRRDYKMDISAQNGVICTIQNMENITHFTVTDEAEVDVKVKEIKFQFK